MSDEPAKTGSVEAFPSRRSMVVSDELNRLMEMLRSACPDEARISFEFDDALRVHIDVRELEDVMAVEALLPTLGQGMFHDVERGLTPHHAFLHRATALVDR